MQVTPAFLSTFGCLALAVLLLWAPRAGGMRDRAWIAALALACAAGLLGGTLDWRAPAWIGGYALLAWRAREATQAWLRLPLLVLTGCTAFAFALHLLPGFSNPVLAANLQLSSGAPPYTLRANFDTAAAGIVLMGVFCERIASLREAGAMLRRVWPVSVSTLVVVLGLGLAIGVVRPDLKWGPWSAAFLCLNLLFTCVTEEAFFRGFLLERVARGLSRWRGGRVAAVLLSSLLFGVAHLRGGALLVLLATVAGLHYAAAYLLSKRIEGAILTHFALNAVHFVAFTYPALTV